MVKSALWGAAIAALAAALPLAAAAQQAAPAPTFDALDPTLITLNVRADDPDAGHNDNDRYAVAIRVTTDSAGSNIGFTDENAVEITQRVDNGMAVFGGGTNAKKTYLPLNIGLVAAGSGQRIGLNERITCFGMSDCAAASQTVVYANGPIGGDEGEDLTVVNYVRQQDHLVKTTVTTVPPPSHCATAVLDDVKASQKPQSVRVADASACHAGDWVILNTEAPTPLPNQSAMQVMASSSGALTGVFNINMRPGQTITPAVVLRLASTYELGQDRLLVNHARPPYAAGHVTRIDGYGFTADGAAWGDGMIGGSALDPGCIMLAADAYTGPPFADGAGTLNSWYEIKRVTSASSLDIYSMSVAADASYRGRGPGDGAYAIAPCARIMVIAGGEVILNTNSFAWAPGDAVEEPITPYADSTGYQLEMGGYTNGATLRAGYMVTNIGARTISQGVLIQGAMPTTGGADPYAWRSGVAIQDAETGVVQFGGQDAYAAEGVTRNGFAALTPGGAPAAGAGLFLSGFDYGAQMRGQRGHAFDITNSVSGHAVQVLWPEVSEDRTLRFPDQSGTLALSLAGETAPIGGAALTAGACASGTAQATGATTAMVALASAAGGVDAGPGFVPKAFVSAPDTVTVEVCALAAGTPAPTRYNVRVLQ
jgi:hypothetical protein